jgi:hypothetical protein
MALLFKADEHGDVKAVLDAGYWSGSSDVKAVLDAGY